MVEHLIAVRLYKQKIACKLLISRQELKKLNKLLMKNKRMKVK
jgi:hypothetical protein